VQTIRSTFQRRGCTLPAFTIVLVEGCKPRRDKKMMVNDLLLFIKSLHLSQYVFILVARSLSYDSSSHLFLKLQQQIFSYGNAKITSIDFFVAGRFC